ncbi:MAG TPA: cation:proton antiporter [Kofleriaceae bacterium]
MTGSQAVVELVIVLGVAAAITLLFQALRLPVVLGYIVAGLVIGPHVPVPLVANASLIHVLSELGVILLMFALGLELRLSTLARVGVGAGLTAVFEVTLVLTAGALVAGALGFASGEAVFAGACLAISSTMLVAKAFEHLRWKGGFTDVVFAILIFEDLIAILLLAVLTGFASGAGLAPHDLLITLAKLAGFLGVLLVGGLLIVPRSIRMIVKQGRPETLIVVALVICFGMAVITEYVGYPVALGAFVAGLVIAESGHSHEVFELVRPFRDVFAMMFFISIGMQIEPSLLAVELPTIAIFTLVVLVMKPLGVALGSLGAGRGVQPSIRAGVSLAQNGELSFVIAGIGVASGIARPSLLAITVGVMCATTLTSAVMIRSSATIARAVARKLPAPIATFVSFYESWLGRLRGRERATWKRVRRPVYIMLFDVAAVVAIVIGASFVGDDAALAIGLEGRAGHVLVIGLVIALTAPFGFSLVRRVVQISRQLAQIIIPAKVVPGTSPAAVDLGLAPRRALTLMLELALATVIAVPMIAAVQPFVGRGGVLAGGVVIILLTITYRSIVDFNHHVRAGSELILELLHQPAQQQPLTQIESVLPGFGGLVSVTLDTSSYAIGKSLAELNLRARTGATVLAIARGEGGFATPEPHEPLRVGDVLAIAGSDEAVALARAAVTSG